MLKHWYTFSCKEIGPRCSTLVRRMLCNAKKPLLYTLCKWPLAQNLTEVRIVYAHLFIGSCKEYSRYGIANHLFKPVNFCNRGFKWWFFLTLHQVWRPYKGIEYFVPKVLSRIYERCTRERTSALYRYLAVSVAWSLINVMIPRWGIFRMLQNYSDCKSFFLLQCVFALLVYFLYIEDTLEK